MVTGELLDSYVENLPNPASFYEASKQQEQGGGSTSTRRILGISLGTRDGEPLDDSAHSSLSASSSGGGGGSSGNGGGAQLSRSDKLHNMTLLFQFMGEKGILSKQPTNEKKGKRPSPSQPDADEVTIYFIFCTQDLFCVVFFFSNSSCA